MLLVALILALVEAARLALLEALPGVHTLVLAHVITDDSLVCVTIGVLGRALAKGKALLIALSFPLSKRLVRILLRLRGRGSLLLRQNQAEPQGQHRSENKADKMGGRPAILRTIASEPSLNLSWPVPGCRQSPR